MELKQIATIYTPFRQKFGIPRQSNLVESAKGQIVFERDYKDPEFIKGLDEYDYIWLIFGFSANKPSAGATVRPPRLGGKKHMGVFATRAPYRPNNIGLSSVKLEEISIDPIKGPVITVSGIDMLDGSPIYDIKPYLAYADSHADAKGGFSDGIKKGKNIEVDFPKELLFRLPEELREGANEVLSQDPRPAYDARKQREFNLSYGGYDICFAANEDKLIVTNVILKQ